MLRSIFNRPHWLLTLFILLVVSTHTATAQSTGFTYQGRLNDNNQVANGNYDFEFKLFTALTGGRLGHFNTQQVKESMQAQMQISQPLTISVDMFLPPPSVDLVRKQIYVKKSASKFASEMQPRMEKNYVEINL